MSSYRIAYYSEDDIGEVVSTIAEADDLATAIFRAGAEWARLDRATHLASVTVVRVEERAGWQEVALP